MPEEVERYIKLSQYYVIMRNSGQGQDRWILLHTFMPTEIKQKSNNETSRRYYYMKFIFITSISYGLQNIPLNSILEFMIVTIDSASKSNFIFNIVDRDIQQHNSVRDWPRFEKNQRETYFLIRSSPPCTEQAIVSRLFEKKVRSLQIHKILCDPSKTKVLWQSSNETGIC